MLKAEFFTNKCLGGILEYRNFIKNNQNIEIISVNLFGEENRQVLLTYRELNN